MSSMQDAVRVWWAGLSEDHRTLVSDHLGGPVPSGIAESLKAAGFGLVRAQMTAAGGGYLTVELLPTALRDLIELTCRPLPIP